MSSPNDTQINVKFTVSAGALKRMFEQLRRLQTKIRTMSKGMTQLNTNFKRLGARFDTTNNKVKKFSSSLKKQSDNQERTRRSMQKLVGQTNKYNKSVNTAGRNTGRAGSSIGLTGFQFGFLGGMALLAGDRLKSFFTDIVRDGISDLDSLNRAVVQSGISLENFLGGDLSEFDVVSDRIKKLQTQFGEFTLGETAGAFEQIGRAVGEDVGLDDIERITKALLVIARIDKTGGAGLPKTAVDLKRVMTQFGIGADGLDLFLDKMVNTNQQGAIELNQLVSSLGFAGAQAQRFGVNINETLALTGFIFEKSGRKAGAAGRTFGNILDKIASVAVATNSTIKNMGINILDAAGNYNEFSQIVDEARVAFARMRAEGKGQIFETALLQEFGFDKTAARGFLSLVQASNAELQALISEVSKPGTANQLSDAIGAGAEIQLKSFENEVRNLKIEFASGLVPAIKEFTAATQVFTKDEGFVNVLRQFGTGIGETLVGALNAIVPVLKVFGNILKDNPVLIKAMATATVGLIGALTALGVTFLALGSFFSIIRIHENLIKRSRELATSTNIAARTYSRFITILGNGKIRMLEFASGVRKGDITLKSMNVTLLRSARNFKAFVLNSRIATIAIKIFSIQSFRALALVGRGWLLALGPIGLAIGAFIAVVGVMKIFESELTATIDKIDATGRASSNLFENIDGLFSLLSGDIDPVFDALNADMIDTNTRIESMSNSWNVFMSDLAQSKLGTAIQNGLDNISTWLDNNIPTWDEFVESLSFNLDTNWAEFMNILGGINIAFTAAGVELDKFLKKHGFNLDPVWAQFDQTLMDIKSNFEILTKPITDFLDSLDFEIPDVWTDFKKILDDIAKNPIVAGGLEILGIIDQFGKNIGKSFAPAPDRGNFVPGAAESFFPSTDPASTGFIGPPAPSGLGSFGSPELLDTITALLEEANVSYVAQLDSLNSNVELLDETNKIGEITNTLQDKTNTLGKKTNALVNSGNSFKSVNNVILKNDTDLLKLMNENLGIGIVEVIRNFNQLSELTTTVAAVQLMFANLIAQGNRAAGKLSSLKVSKEGRFSITDPGVSSSDKALIGSASTALSLARAQQVRIEPVVTIEINPVITIADGSQTSAEEAADLIVNETTNKLQKSASLIALQ